MYDAYLELLGFQHPSKGFHLHFSGEFKTPRTQKSGKPQKVNPPQLPPQKWWLHAMVALGANHIQ